MFNTNKTIEAENVYVQLDEEEKKAVAEANIRAAEAQEEASKKMGEVAGIAKWCLIGSVVCSVALTGVSIWKALTK